MPTGYPAQGWSPGYAVPPAAPKPGSGLRLTALLLAIAGGVVVIVACLLPYAHYPSSVSGPHAPSILNPGPAAALWFAAEPVGVALVAIAAGIVLVVSSSQAARWTTAGVLLAFGIQTPLLFAGYLFGIAFGSGFHQGPAGAVGILGGLLLLAAGILGLVGTAVSQRAAGQPGGTAAPGGAVTLG